MNIIEKLVEVRKSCSYLKKENKGEQYQYVSSSQTLAALKSKMDELGLLLVPRVIGTNIRESTVEFKDKYDKPKRQTTYFTELNMEYTWMNAEDPKETIVCTWYGQGVDIAGEKGVGKALTYAEKYFMLKFFNIPTDKDDPDAFQKKHDDDSGGKPKSSASYDNLELWIEKFSADGATWKDGSLVTSGTFKDWYETNSLVAAEKKKLDGENLSKINRLYSQYLDTMLERQERKAA
jgi:hypothetical protein